MLSVVIVGTKRDIGDDDQGFGRSVSTMLSGGARPGTLPASRIVANDGLPYIRVGLRITNEDVRRILDETE